MGYCIAQRCAAIEYRVQYLSLTNLKDSGLIPTRVNMPKRWTVNKGLEKGSSYSDMVSIKERMKERESRKEENGGGLENGQVGP